MTKKTEAYWNETAHAVDVGAQIFKNDIKHVEQSDIPSRVSAQFKYRCTAIK